MSSTPTYPERSSTPAASDAAKKAADRASNLAKRAVDQIDASRGTVAQGIERTADAMRSYAPHAVSERARVAADSVENAADYIRTHDVRSMGSDLTATVRRNPGPSIIAAAACGFLLGVFMRRR
jgi:ElaB/YqjD/DUF883 family membrane-anchored ribosome-binding protein